MSEEPVNSSRNPADLSPTPRDGRPRTGRLSLALLAGMAVLASGCASLPADDVREGFQPTLGPNGLVTRTEDEPPALADQALQPPAVLLPGQAQGLPLASDEPDPPIHSTDANLLHRIREGFALPELPESVVRPYIVRYQRNPELLRRPFDRGAPYLHHIVEQIEARGMPLELALLPIVESAFNPQATSSAKAAGIWQFIPSTGRAFNLAQDWWMDERRDVISSTEAALEYLSRITALHGGDWFLGLASYNWGEGAVQRAVRASRARGLPGHYLSLQMPNETRQYVPQLIALRNILRNPEKYGLQLPFIEDRPALAILEKDQSIDLALAAKFANLDLSEFKAFNPHLHRPVLSVSRSNRLVLPVDRVGRYQRELARYEAAGIPLVTWLPRTLQKGESLQSIATQTGISLQELASANGLSASRALSAGSTILAPSRRLQVAREQGEIRLAELERGAKAKSRRPAAKTQPARPASPAPAESTASAGPSAAHIARSTPDPGAENSAAVDHLAAVVSLPPTHHPDRIEAALADFKGLKAVEVRQPPAPPVYYKVRKHDTLSDIAERFSISIAKLRQLNRLRDSTIWPGMKLRVRAG